VTGQAGHNPRRWVSEDAVLGEMERLNNESMTLVGEFTLMAPDAAAAEARYKTVRATTVLRIKALPDPTTGKRPPISECEYAADADPVVAEAYLARLTTASLLEATREALRSIRVNQDALRTAAASARDGVTGPGWKGRA